MGVHILVIHSPEENMGRCTLCGTLAELRPYGPGGKAVCFDCGMRNEQTAIAEFAKLDPFTQQDKEPRHE